MQKNSKLGQKPTSKKKVLGDCPTSNQDKINFEELVTQIDGIIWEADAHTLEFIYVSPQIKKILGYDPEQWLSDSKFWENNIHPDDRREIKKLIREKVKKKLNYVVDYRIKSKNGYYKWVNDRVSVIRENEDSIKLRGFLVDVTTEKILLQNEKEEKELNERLIQQLPNAFFLFDETGKFLLWNKALENITGYSSEELTGMKPMDFFSQEEHPIALKHIEVALTVGLTDVEMPILSKDGIKIPYHFTASRVNYKGKPCLFGVGANIASVKQTQLENLLMLNNTDESFLLVNRELEIVAFNRQFSEWYESYSGRTMLKGGKLLSYYIGNNPATINKLLVKSLEGRKSKFKMNIDVAHDEKRTFQLCFKPAHDESKNIVGVFITATDITREIAATQKLKISEERYKALVQDGSDMTAIIDLNGVYQYVSPNYPNIVGHTEKDLLGKNGFDFFHPDDVDLIKNEFSRFQSEKRVKSSPYRFKRKDESWCWMQSIGTNLIEDESIAGIVINSVDISDLINVQNYLQKSNERYELVSKVTQDAIYEWDILNDSFIWGDSFYRIFGHLKREKRFSLKDWEKLMHPIDFVKNLDSWTQFLSDENQNRWQKEFRFKRTDGTYAYVEEIGHVIRNENGEPIQMIGVLRDISDTKKTEIQKNTQHQIALIFKEEKSLKQALDKVLNHLSLTGDFLASELWLMASDGKHFNLVSKNVRGKKAELFYKKSNTLPKVETSTGFLGTVWESLKIEILNHIDFSTKFVRNEAAKKAGLKSILGIPLFHNELPIGVLMLFSDSLLNNQLNQNELYSSLSSFLGMEIKRKQQEEEMFLLFHSSPDILAIASPQGKFTKVNPAFCSLLGYSEEEITSKPFSYFIHPDDLTDTSSEYEETITGDRKANNFVNRYITKSGEYKWISWNSSDVFGEDHSVFAYGRDVTQVVELRKMLDSATSLSRVGGWEYDIINDKLILSPITREILQLPQDFELKFHASFDFCKEDYSRELAIQKVNHAIEKGIPFDIELQLITFRGKERWVRSIGNAEFVNGKCRRLFGSVQDINTQKQIEIRLKNISDNIPGVMFQYYIFPDGTDRLHYVTEGAREIWGISAEECMRNISKVWKGIIEGGDYETVKKSIAESAKKLNRWHARWRYVMPDGSVRYHEGYGNPQKKIDGTILWDSIIMDITDMHYLEELAERTSKISLVGSWELNLLDNIDQMYWSPMICQIHEVDENFRPSLDTCFKFYNKISREKIESSIQKLINTGEEFDLELQITSAKGNTKWVRCIGKSDRTADKCTRIYGSLQDITYQKEYEKSLRELNVQLEKHARELAISNEELEQFAYVASHDLQEPLRMITGFLTQLEKKYMVQLDDRAQQYIHFAVDGAVRMRQIILDILDFSRVGKHEGGIEQINLNELLEETCLLQKKRIEEKKAKINFKNLPTINSFRSPLVQIFQNLIGNALKYSKEEISPIVSVKVEELPDEWKFSIKDNGIGINEKYHEKIFIIFQRLHNKNEYSGTGMGLAIVKKIIENLGGRIWVESQEGKGSIFYFTIPKLVIILPPNA